MTLHDVQKSLVDEKHVFTKKQLNKMVIRTVLFIATYSMTVGMVVFNILGAPASLVIFVLFALMFLWLFDSCNEDSNFALKMFKVVKFWWTGIIFFIASYFVLIFTNIIR